MIYAFITGNIGKDAEVRQAGKDQVCSFNVASSRKVKGEEQTVWTRCSLWGRRGEALAQYLTKGSKVAVTGELSTREHDGKTYLELRVAEIDLMGGKSAGGGRSGGGGSQSSNNDDYDAGSGGGTGAGAGDMDDIPFGPRKEPF